MVRRTPIDGARVHGKRRQWSRRDRSFRRLTPQDHGLRGYGWMYVLSGELRVIVGEAEFTVAPARWPAASRRLVSAA
jgi:hypothetical protein